MVRHFLILSVLLFLSGSLPGARIPQYEGLTQGESAQVKQLVSFVEVLLNTVGSEKVAVSEKNTIISTSYLKAFTGRQAQVEDDLHQRDVIINKEIQDYLKDVDIFFKDANFDFEIKSVEKLKNKSGKDYLKVRALRKLNGISFNNEKVSNQIERFFEINLDDPAGYKIASIYNSTSNNRLTIQQWWENLSFEWKVIFQRKLKTEINASKALLPLSINELNLAYNRYIESLEPLNVLVNLKKLNISNTIVQDLTPLNGLNNLEELYISNTVVKDLNMVRNLPSLKILSIEDTEVSDITPLLELKSIRKIVCTNTRIRPEDLALLKTKLPNCEIIAESVTLRRWWTSLDPAWQNVFRKHVAMLKLEPNADELSQISELQKLDLSGMQNITDLQPIDAITDLKEVNISNTRIRDITPLQKMKGLERLNISNTPISNIKPIMNHIKLSYINADYTEVQDSVAIELLSSKDEIKVIFNSATYVGIWLKLKDTWKKKFTNLIGYTGTAPLSLEKFYDILKIRKLDINDNRELSDLQGLALVPALRSLNIGKMMTVSDPTLITGLRQLESLDCSYNPIESLEWITQLPKLKQLNIEYTKVSELEPLEELRELESLKLSGTKIKNLNSLRIIDPLQELEVNNTAISSLGPLFTLPELKKVSCYNTKLSEKDVQSFREVKPACEVLFY